MSTGPVDDCRQHIFLQFLLVSDEVVVGEEDAPTPLVVVECVQFSEYLFPRLRTRCTAVLSPRCRRTRSLKGIPWSTAVHHLIPSRYREDQSGPLTGSDIGNPWEELDVGSTSRSRSASSWGGCFGLAKYQVIHVIEQKVSYPSLRRATGTTGEANCLAPVDYLPGRLLLHHHCAQERSFAHRMSSSVRLMVGVDKLLIPFAREHGRATVIKPRGGEWTLCARRNAKSVLETPEVSGSGKTSNTS